MGVGNLCAGDVGCFCEGGIDGDIRACLCSEICMTWLGVSECVIRRTGRRCLQEMLQLVCCLIACLGDEGVMECAVEVMLCG